MFFDICLWFNLILMIIFILYMFEAISMSDRVVVLTNRPAKVKKIYDIRMEGKSTPIENRKCREFSDYYDMIWKEIDYHV